MKYWMLGFLTALLPMTAQARVRVGNCDTDQSYSVKFESNGETFEKVLQPGEHYLTFVHPLTLITDDGTRIRTRELNEYCIWNGKLRLQRRRTSQWRN